MKEIKNNQNDKVDEEMRENVPVDGPPSFGTIVSEPIVPGSFFSQAWIGLAFWMTFGMLIEGLIAFRVPAYLQDPVRRELCRLGHAHGTLLSIVLIIAGVCMRQNVISIPSSACIALQAGAVLMPVGFILGGIGHFESDPNPLVFLPPLGGLFVIFGVVAAALSTFKK